MIKKFFKLISLLWRCAILAIRIKLLEWKSNRLARKGDLHDDEDCGTQLKMMRFAIEGLSYCYDAEQIMKELKRA